MDWERKLKIDNIITAYQLRYFGYEEVQKRLKEILQSDIKKIVLPTHQLN